MEELLLIVLAKVEVRVPILPVVEGEDVVDGFEFGDGDEADGGLGRRFGSVYSREDAGDVGT